VTAYLHLCVAANIEQYSIKKIVIMSQRFQLDLQFERNAIQFHIFHEWVQKYVSHTYVRTAGSLVLIT
jgi:hypothetical protein